MDSLSPEILAILSPFAILFSKPSWNKALTLLLGTLLCVGKRTVCSALRVMGLKDEAGFAKYHHLLNRAQWSLMLGAKILFLMLLALVPEGLPIVILIDETLERRRGKRIAPKGYYRDAVRSSKSQVVKTSGLKWLVMALSVKFPWIPRKVALPFLTVLEFSKKYDDQRKRKHKTTLEWTSQMIAQVLRWIGKTRKLILVGDGGFAVGELAWNCIRQGATLVSRLKMNARLFAFPLPRERGTRGRPSLRGKKLANFKQMLSMEELPWREREITGYGGVKRIVRFISAACMWGAEGTPVPIRWVLVVDPSGKMDPLPLMSTDLEMAPEEIIELYIDRWGLEVTFEESREHLGVETQRQWSDQAIARSTPVLMGLYSLVCLMGNRLIGKGKLKVEKAAWYQKDHATFADLLRAVRMELWRDSLISQKAKISPSEENIPSEMAQWAELIIRRVLQAA